MRGRWIFTVLAVGVLAAACKDFGLGFPTPVPTPGTGGSGSGSGAALVVLNNRGYTVYAYAYVGPPDLSIPCTSFTFRTAISHGQEYRLEVESGEIGWMRIYYTSDKDGCRAPDFAPPSVSGSSGRDVVVIVTP